jgi:hypothetical protein
MTDPVWSVIVLLSIGLVGTLWCIYKILNWDNEENNVSLQSKKDQQSH